MSETARRDRVVCVGRSLTALSLNAGILTVIAGCGGGGGNHTTPSTITSVTVSCSAASINTNQTSTCTPTVNGTGSFSSAVTWSVSPTSMGAVSGAGVFTPTSAGAATVTATSVQDSTQSGGATVTVTLAAPSDLTYPQTTINAIVGQAITADTPTVTGTISSYSVSPTLPAGLSLDSTTGTLSGTPTAAVAQATYTVTATNATGSATATIQITVNIAAPSNLVYPQTAIKGYVGQAITTDTPTVSGTVSSYSVNPALPAGLSLNTTSGAISGTPTATVAQTSYTVTATNATGSTTATVQITVTFAAPLNLVYPQTTISVSVGQAITSDIPTVTGPVSSYSVSPALPAGLSLDTTTGILSGTPTTVVAQAAYTITATNPGGSTSAVVNITVVQAPNVLLELGHAADIGDIRFEGGRVLSVDQNGRWVLWNYASGAILADGNLATGGNFFYTTPSPIDMAGQTVVDGVPNGLEVRALLDGHVMSTIAYPDLNVLSSATGPPIAANGAWWKLASDGSYICIGSKTGLTIYTLAGDIAASKSGDYSKANSFAAPGQVLVALGPAGQNVIEAISAADGMSTISPQFSGQFSSWFVDGGKFLTTLSTTVWVYSNAGVQQALVQLPSTTYLTGQGNWIWTFQNYSGNSPLNIYAVGSDTPALTFNGGAGSTIMTSGTTLAINLDDSTKMSVIDLSGSTPSETDYTLPVANPSAFAATSGSQWVVGNQHGVLLDGASLPSAPRYLGQGQAWSIAGSSNSVAISTAIGTISVIDPSPATLDETINFSSGKVSLSSDGSVLGAFANANDVYAELDRTLNFYSLPSGNVIQSFPYTYPSSDSSTSTFLVDFTLAASGGTIGQVIETGPTNLPVLTRQVTPIAGTPVIWTDTGSLSPNTGLPNPIFLSPDGTLIAVYNAAQSSTSVTNIYKNGTLVTAVPGAAVGWIDNNRLLVNEYGAASVGSGPYLGCTIYSSTGGALATPALPQLQSIETVNSDSVYDPASNAIYSLTTGQATWTASFPNSGVGLLSGVGAVSGTYVVYESGHSVVVETF